jgi:hypothetical protein
MSALPPKADISRTSQNVRYVPEADIAPIIGPSSVRANQPNYTPSAARRRLSKWSPNSFSAAAPLPENDAPCMVANSVGLSSASLRMVGAVVGRGSLDA